MSNYFNDRMGQLLDMRRNGIPEHVKNLKITSTLHHDYVAPMCISVEMLNGKRFSVNSSGNDTIGEIVDMIIERC